MRLAEYNNAAYSWSFGIGFHIHPHEHHRNQKFFVKLRFFDRTFRSQIFTEVILHNFRE